MQRFNDELGDIQVPEFFPPGFIDAEFDRMFTDAERDGISIAAKAAHKGSDVAAEFFRRMAGYGGLT